MPHSRIPGRQRNGMQLRFRRTARGRTPRRSRMPSRRRRATCGRTSGAFPPRVACAEEDEAARHSRFICRRSEAKRRCPRSGSNRGGPSARRASSRALRTPAPASRVPLPARRAARRSRPAPRARRGRCARQRWSSRGPKAPSGAGPRPRTRWRGRSRDPRRSFRRGGSRLRIPRWPAGVPREFQRPRQVAVAGEELRIHLRGPFDNTRLPRRTGARRSITSPTAVWMMIDRGSSSRARDLLDRLVVAAESGKELAVPPMAVFA